MSYSFNVRASDKSEAMDKVIAELDKVVVNQPVHAKDRDAARRAAEAFIDILPTDEDKDVQVYMSGSCSWSGASGDEVISQAGVNVSAALVAREATPA